MSSRPTFIAHRGESADAPENTLAAFRLAWERKVDAIELDVHLTREGALVVCHDADTFRTTGVHKAICNTALDELRTLDAGSWKGERWRGEPIPTLRNALATVPSEGRCFVEVKVGPEAVAVLTGVVRASGIRPEQLAVISFQAETVAEARRRLPKVKAYYLSGFRRDPRTGAWSPDVETLIARAEEIGADGLDLSCDGPVDADFVQRVHAAGLEVYVWTVDSPKEARCLAAAGVDGITSNRAAALQKASAAPRSVRSARRTM